MPKVKITGLPQMKSGGYTVRKSNARKGKTHVVIGPDGTKKYFGDPKMGEKGKSKHGKEAFYARHAKNLKGNPYFRAYARATWADGGMVDMYEGGGDVPTPMYNPSVPEVSVFDLTKQAMGGLIYEEGGPTEPPADSTAYYNAEAKFQTDLAKTHAKYGNRKAAEEAMTKARKAYSDASRQQFKGKPGFDKMGNPIKALGGPIKAGEGYVQNDDMSGFANGGRYATSDSPVPQRTSGLMNYLGYGQTRPFAMGGYKMYFDGGPGDPPVPGKTSTFGTGLTGQAGSKAGTKINMSEYENTWQPTEEAKRFFAGLGEKMGEKDLAGIGWKRTVVDGNVYYDRNKANAPGFMERFKYVPVSNPEDVKSMKAIGIRNPYGMQYWGEFNTNPSTAKLTAPVATQPTQPVTTGPQYIDPIKRGYTQINELQYSQQQGNPAFKDIEYESVPSGTPGVMSRYQKLIEGSPSWQKMQPGYTPGMATKAMGGYMYAQGGSKLPEPILRARLESHMSPEEADNYISNYASGGNTGTGILGNMTFNPSPWKYVEGGQLGPYPYSGYKSDLSEFKKGGIHIKPENRGKFTASAKKAGMGVQEYARHVLANKENYSPTLVKRANFARNAAKWQHAYGGYQVPQYYPGGPIPNMYNPVMRAAMKLATKQSLESYGPGIENFTKDKSDQPFYGLETSDAVPREGFDNQEQGFESFNKMTPFADLAPRDRTDYEQMKQFDVQGLTDRQKAVLGNLDTQLGLPVRDFEKHYERMINPSTSIDDLAKKAGEAAIVKIKNQDRRPRGRVSTTTDKQGTDLYYPNQWMQQAAAPLAYLGAEGKRYDQAIRRTYNPELYSARMPLMAIDEAGRAAAMDLAARNTGAGNYMANRIALANKLGMSKAQTREGIDKTNVDIRNDAGYKNLAMQTSYDEQDARNKAQAITNYYKTLNQLGTVGATTGKDMRAEQMDKFKWQYLPEIYKAMALDPELMKKYKEGLGI